MSVLQDEKPSFEAPTSTPSAPAASPSDHRPALSSAGSRTTKSPTRSEPNAGNSISAPAAVPIAAGKKTPSKLARANTASHKDADDSLRGSAVARATPPPSAPSPANSTAIDPLSQHIFMRTNTDHSIPSRLRTQPRPESPLAADGLPRPSADLSTKFNTPNTDAARDKKKTGSFLSRLSMRGNKRKDDDDDESEISEQRMEGVNALVFGANSGAGGGYIPIHKEPPRYIKIKAHNKKHKEFDRMFLAQELVGTRPPKTETETIDDYPVVTVSVPGGGRKRAETGGAIWASEFSKDGKYFAVAGRDKIVRIWAVITTHEERRAHEEEEAANGATGERLSAPVFREKPICEFEGHTGEVLDISWSKNNFLLSTSMDKTVRLWHMSRNECLCTFKHKELVSKVAFHPTDDRFFLAGSLDAALRLWSIPDKSVAYSAQLTDLITAVAFSPDGKTAIAGQLSGVCTFFDTEGLKLQAQMHVRSSRGKNAKGSKITGIQTVQEPKTGRREGDVKLLITSTDSRIRVYNMRDKTLEMKLKGHEHTCSQLFASFSDNGAYIICGSEDRKAFIWNTSSAESENRDKKPCEYFNAHSDVVTTAVFAPMRSRQLLGSSGDPIYDLCNPPPVMLMSVEETTTSQPSEDLNNGTAEPTTPQPPPTVKKPEESPAYIARSTHYDGNILVTTDDMGIIKVFRQDCAWAKRKHETWETGSTFSRRMGAGSGLIGRSASIITRTSQGSVSHSRRGSLSQPPVGFPGVVSGPPSATSTPQLGGHDRILSWRQGIVSHGGQSRPVSMVTPTRSERSLSPSKGARSGMPLSASAGNMARSSPLASQFHIKSDPTSPLSGTFSHLSLTREDKSHEDGESSKKKNSSDANKKRSLEGGRKSTATDGLGNKERKSSQDHNANSAKTSSKKDKDKDKDEGPTHPPTPSFSFRPADEDDAEEDHLRLDPAGASYSFWNLNRWKGIAGLRASISGASPDANKQHGRSSSEARETSPSNANDGGGTRRKSLAGSLFPRPSPLSRGDSASIDHVVEDSGRRRSSAAALSHATTDDDGGRHLSPHGGVRNRGRSPFSGGSRGDSIVSRLSSELTSEEPSEAEGEGEEEDMRCVKCGGKKFKARRVEGSAQQRLVCGRCGKVVD